MGSDIYWATCSRLLHSSYKAAWFGLPQAQYWTLTQRLK